MTAQETDKNSPIKIRQMLVADLPLCRHLVNEAGWNQTDTDWLRTMDLEPGGCFVGEIDSVPVATTTTCVFGATGWIAMVLVDMRFRNRGIAKQMLLHAMDYLRKSGATTIRLDATSLGRPLYQKLGFEDEYEVTRFRREPASDRAGKEVSRLLLMDKSLDEIVELDSKATGCNRKDLLKSLLSLGDRYSTIIKENESLAGFACARPGNTAVQIGPAVASTNIGNDLLTEMLLRFETEKVFIDIPNANEAAVDWARQNGFEAQRTFMRMYWGRKILDNPALIWASFGPEKG